MSRFRLSRRPQSVFSEPRLPVELSTLAPYQLLILVFKNVEQDGKIKKSDRTKYTYHELTVELVRVERDMLSDRWILHVHTKSGESRRIRKRFAMKKEVTNRLDAKWQTVTSEPKSIFA